MKHRIMLDLWFCFEKDKREQSTGVKAEVTVFEKVSTFQFPPLFRRERKLQVVIE